MVAGPPPSCKGTAPVLLPLVTGLATLVASCSSEAPPRPTVALRDSAGVRIVENAGPPPPSDAGWRIAATPRLTIGTVEGDTTQMLYGVAGAHRMADGRIAILNAGSRQVRVYDGQGQFLLAWGGPGEGPEEFGSPILGGSVADTLVVVDQAQHRITMVHADAGFVRLARVADDVGGFLFPAGTFANGQTVFGGAFNMRRFGELVEGVNRAPTLYRSSNPDGSLAADFGDKLGAEFLVTFPGGGRIPETALIPFGKTPHATVSSTRLYFGSGDGYEVEAYDSTGTLVAIVRWDREPIPVTDEDRARYVELGVANIEDEEQARQARRRLAELPTPDVFPPFGELEADILGFVWVQDYPRPGDGEHFWNIFGPDGALTARVTTPEDLDILEIGEDYLLGLRRDELDVEYVELYALERPRGN